MSLPIHDSWIPVIGEEFSKEYMQKLANWIGYTRQSRTILPAKEDVFKAFQLTPFGQIKVIIIGQNPYPQDGVADGLAFSFKDGKKHQQGMQALDIILDEIERDCYKGFNLNRDYDLSYLAKQGVLLLNSWLTVFKGDPNSHKDIGWQIFTSKVIQELIKERTPKVFMLWGNEAKDLFKKSCEVIANDGILIQYTDHLVLASYHPAADLHNRDQFGQVTAQYPNGFSGCKHFSQANNFLLDKHQMTPIDWAPIGEPYFNPQLSNKTPF